jgi:acetyl esterase/lipase
MIEPVTQRLWPDRAPGAVGTESSDVPCIAIYRPHNPDGSAIIICPGGGYVFYAQYEAEPVARWLATLGVTGIILSYRLAPRYRHPVPLMDITRAIRLVRANAASWSLDPGRVGVMGFSAGGHLAAQLSTHFDHGDSTSDDPIERVSSRPELAVLLYPVITMTRLSHHTATTHNLLGDSPVPLVINALSCEQHVTSQTPPTFIYHATGDPNVPVINALLYADALSASGVAFEMHLYDRIAHGVGLAANDACLRTWPSLCANWLNAKGFGRGPTGTGAEMRFR